MTELIIGFLGCGGLAIAVTFAMKYFRGDKSEVIEKVHEAKQKLMTDRVKETMEKQTKVAVNIKEKEKLSEDTVKKIKDIEKKAAEEVEEALKQDNIKKIHNQIDSDWGDL